MRIISLSFIAIIFLIASCNNSNQDQILVKSKPSWYKPPLFSVMTGFIYYPKSEYSIGEWDENLGKNFNAEDFVKGLKDANVDYLIFYDKWIDGFVFHDTKTTKFKTKRDFLKDVSEACNKHNVSLILYYNAVSDGNPEFEKGFARDYYGNIFPFSSFWPTNRSTLHNSDFRNNSLEQLREIVSSYGKISGIWFDIFSEVGDARNESVIKDAEKWFQKPFPEITAEEFYLFQEETMGNYLKDAREIVDQYQKDIVFTVNGSIEGMNRDNVHLLNIDLLLDYWMTETNSFVTTDFQSWRAHFTPKPVEMGSLISKDWFAVKDSLAPGLRSKSKEEVISETALAVCRGASIYLAITPGYAGDMGEGMEGVKAAGSWYGKVKPYLKDSEMYGNIGIVLGTPSVEGKGLPVKNVFWADFDKDQITALYEAVSLCEDISGAGYFPKVLYSYADYSSWPQSLTDLKAIVVPELAVLDKAHIQILRDYVKNGGRLISFAHSTFLNEKGERLADQALRDLFGIQNKTGSEKKGGKIIFQDTICKKYFDANIFESKYVLNPVYDKSLKIIATLSDENKQPVIFENKHGQGKSVYIATGEAEFRGMPAFWKGILTMNGIMQSFKFDTLNVSKPGVAHSQWTVKGIRQKNLSRYYVVLKESAKGKVIHIIDRKGEKSGVNIILDASLLGKVSAASKIETETPVVLNDKNGTVLFSVTCDPVASILFKEN
jgi:alpha-L-fucosidase